MRDSLPVPLQIRSVANQGGCSSPDVATLGLLLRLSERHECRESRALKNPDPSIKTTCERCSTNAVESTGWKGSHSTSMRGRKMRFLRPRQLSARCNCGAGDCSRPTTANTRIARTFCFRQGTVTGLSFAHISSSVLFLVAGADVVAQIEEKCSPVVAASCGGCCS